MVLFITVVTHEGGMRPNHSPLDSIICFLFNGRPLTFGRLTGVHGILFFRPRTLPGKPKMGDSNIGDLKLVTSLGC